MQASGIKVALRYPRDHQALFPGDRAVTLHNDCIFNGGPDGHDGGTFPVGDRQTWVDYTRQVAGGNTFGGEGCNQAGDSTYDWTNWTDLCGDNGLVPYIEQFQIAYLNVSVLRYRNHANGNKADGQSLVIRNLSRSCSITQTGRSVSMPYNRRFSSMPKAGYWEIGTRLLQI